MSVLLKDRIIKELKKTQWDQDDSNRNSDLSFEALINGLYDYLENDYLFTGTYTGSDLIVPTPAPVGGVSDNKVHLGPKNTYLNTFKTIVKSGVASGGISRMFLALQTVLTGTVQASIVSLTPPLTTYIPPVQTPLVPIAFPSISLYGTPCELEMLGKKPSSMEEGWTIIAKYIQMGLNINVVPPMPTNGTLISSVTAITVAFLVYN